MANGLAFGEAVLHAVWVKSGLVVSVVTTDAIVGLRTLDGDSINRGDMLGAPPHSDVRGHHHETDSVVPTAAAVAVT